VPLVSDTPTATTESTHYIRPGKSPLPPEILRSKSIRLAVTPGQLSDIHYIAEAWNVPASTACYGMVASFLGHSRGASAETHDKDQLIEQACRLYLSNLSPK